MLTYIIKIKRFESNDFRLFFQTDIFHNIGANVWHYKEKNEHCRNVWSLTMAANVSF